MRRFPEQWDPARKQFIAATPEETVRQTLLNYLLEKGYPLSAIQTEYAVQGGRFDVAVSAPDGSLWLLAECKAASRTYSPEALWRKAFTQLRRYQQALPPVHHLAIAIGPSVWCWEVKTGTLLSEVPSYPI